MGFVFFPLARQQQAQREIGFELIGIGLDGAPVEASSSVEVILMIGNIAGVEEGASIGGMRGEVGMSWLQQFSQSDLTITVSASLSSGATCEFSAVACEGFDTLFCGRAPALRIESRRAASRKEREE